MNTTQEQESTTKELSLSRLVYIASEISLILDKAPDRTHFEDEEQTKVTHFAWDCLVEDGDLKLLLTLWVDGTLCLHAAEDYAFNKHIEQRLIGLAALQGLDWNIFELNQDEDDENHFTNEKSVGMVH
jgi:hypothetical protein